MKITNKTGYALAASLVALSLNASGAIVIAGIDTWDNAATPTVPQTAAGVIATATASASTGSWAIGESNGRGSSKDTTWGTFDGGGVGASSATTGNENLTVTNGRPSAEVTLTITNNGTVDLNLAMFHMDVVAFRPNAPRAYALNVLAGSDITVGTVFTSADDAITHLGGGLLTDDSDSATHDQHDDLDLDLSGLDDHTLAVGESALIQIAFSSGTGSGGGHHLFLDNVAISGDAAVVPEPSSIFLLGLGSLTLLARRRK